MHREVRRYVTTCVYQGDPFVHSFCHIPHTCDSLHCCEWVNDVSSFLFDWNFFHKIRKHSTSAGRYAEIENKWYIFRFFNRSACFCLPFSCASRIELCCWIFYRNLHIVLQCKRSVCVLFPNELVDRLFLENSIDKCSIGSSVCRPLREMTYADATLD